jgi:hypothetical protein
METTTVLSRLYRINRLQEQPEKPFTGCSLVNWQIAISPINLAGPNE